MDGREVFKFAIRVWKSYFKGFRGSKFTIDDIDMIIPIKQIKELSVMLQRMKIDEQILMNLEEYGNTSAASVAIALTEAKKQNVIKEKTR